MADEYSKAILKVAVGQICQSIGWHSIQSTPLNILIDLLRRNMLEIGKLIRAYSEHGNRTSVMLPDIARALEEMGVSVTDLEDYVNNVESVPFPHKVPKYPVPKESNLNFLKPGSREVILRPIYIHDHLPPMYPETEEENTANAAQAATAPSLGDAGTSGRNEAAVVSISTDVDGAVFKKPEAPVPVSDVGVVNRRLRFEDHCSSRLIREISSVMMTTGGFISPAREGKLPEARTPFWLGKGPFLEDSSDEEEPPQPEFPIPAMVSARHPEVALPSRDGIENVKPPRAPQQFREELNGRPRGTPKGPPGRVHERRKMPVNPKYRSFEFGDDDVAPAQIRPLVPREQKFVADRNAVAAAAAAKARVPFKKVVKGPQGPLIRKAPPTLSPAEAIRRMGMVGPSLNRKKQKMPGLAKKNNTFGMKVPSFAAAAALPKIKKKAAAAAAVDEVLPSAMSGPKKKPVKPKQNKVRAPSGTPAVNGRPISPSMPPLIPKKALLVDAELSGRNLPNLNMPPLMPLSAREEAEEVKPTLPVVPTLPPSLIRREPTNDISIVPSVPLVVPVSTGPPVPSRTGKSAKLAKVIKALKPTPKPKKRKLPADGGIDAESVSGKPKSKKRKILSAEHVPPSPPTPTLAGTVPALSKTSVATPVSAPIPVPPSLVPPVSSTKTKTPAVIEMKPTTILKRKKIPKLPKPKLEKKNNAVAPLPKGKTPAIVETSSSSEDEGPSSSRRPRTSVVGNRVKKEVPAVVKLPPPSPSPSPPPRAPSPTPPERSPSPLDLKVKTEEEVRDVRSRSLSRSPSPARRSPSPSPPAEPKPSASLFSSVFSKLPAHPSFIPNFLPKSVPPPFGGPPSFPHPSFVPFPNCVPPSSSQPPPLVPRSAVVSPEPRAESPPPPSLSRNSGSVGGRESPAGRPESATSFSSSSRPTTPAVVTLTQKSKTKDKEASSEEKKERKLKKKEKKDKEKEAKEKEKEKEKKKKKKDGEGKKEKKEKKKKTTLIFDPVRSFAPPPAEPARAIPKLTLKLGGNGDRSPPHGRSPVTSPVPPPPPTVVEPVPPPVATQLPSPATPMPSRGPFEAAPKITIKPLKKPEKKMKADKIPAPPAPTPTPPKEKKAPKPAKVPKVPKPGKTKTPKPKKMSTVGAVKVEPSPQPAAAAKTTPPPPRALTPPPSIIPASALVTAAAAAAASAAKPEVVKPRGRGRPSKSSIAAAAAAAAAAASASASAPVVATSTAAVAPSSSSSAVPAAAVASSTAAVAAGVQDAASGKKGTGKKKEETVGLITQTVGSYVDEHGDRVWICPSCGRVDDGTPMIGCDTCDDWYHWVCVGIVDEPNDENWFCPRCLAKEKGKSGKGKSRKKAA